MGTPPLFQVGHSHKEVSKKQLLKFEAKGSPTLYQIPAPPPSSWIHLGPNKKIISTDTLLNVTIKVKGHNSVADPWLTNSPFLSLCCYCISLKITDKCILFVVGATCVFCLWWGATYVLFVVACYPCILFVVVCYPCILFVVVCYPCIVCDSVLPNYSVWGGVLPLSSVCDGLLPMYSLCGGALPMYSLHGGVLPMYSLCGGVLPMYSLCGGVLPMYSLCGGVLLTYSACGGVLPSGWLCASISHWRWTRTWRNMTHLYGISGSE